MKATLFAAALLLATPLLAAEPATAKLPDWMAGTWMMEDGATWTDAIWTDPRGGVMLGVGRSGFAKALDSWEIVRIERAADGSIAFVTQPQGGQATRFPLVLASAEAVEFANPANPYPQRIRYARQGKLLIAEISRMDGSRLQRWQFRPVVPPQD